jgi:hypothetical protein
VLRLIEFWDLRRIKSETACGSGRACAIWKSKARPATAGGFGLFTAAIGIHENGNRRPHVFRPQLIAFV